MLGYAFPISNKRSSPLVGRSDSQKRAKPDNTGMTTDKERVSRETSSTRTSDGLTPLKWSAPERLTGLAPWAPDTIDGKMSWILL